MVYHYDAKLGALRTAGSFANTVIPSVLGSLEFWFFFFVHLAIYAAYHSNVAKETFEAWHLDWKFVSVVGGITTFFQVFYANNCYARYMRLYDMTKEVITEALSFVYVLQIYVKGPCNGHALLATRYLIVSLLLHFRGLSEPKDIHVTRLQSAGFLKKMEADILHTHKPEHRLIVVLSWASWVARVGCEEAKTPQSLHSVFLGSVLRLHQKQNDISEQLGLPVPFQYFHLLSIMLIVNLSLWAYSVAVSGSLFAPLVFFAAAFIFIGMMALSSELADPFGDDEVDFPVEKWIRACVELIVDFSQTKFQQSKDDVNGAAEVEVRLPHNIHERIHFDDEAENEAFGTWKRQLGRSPSEISSSASSHKASLWELSPLHATTESHRTFAKAAKEEERPFVGTHNGYAAASRGRSASMESGRGRTLVEHPRYPRT